MEKSDNEQKKGANSTPHKKQVNNNTGAKRNAIKKDNRARNFASVLYPESMAPDALQQLRELKVPHLLSPLHDKDINATGEPKKPHYHLVLCFEGKKSIDQVSELLMPTNSVGVEVVSSLRAYGRYLCHLDNPEKAQYSIDEVQAYSIDYLNLIGSASDRYKAVADMMEWVSDNQCYSFSDLLDYSRIHRYDWFVLLCDNSAVVMEKYIKSFSFTKEVLRKGVVLGKE